MLVARKKRKENIAEYILYLYQIEDLIRAFKLDAELIENQLVSKYEVDDKTRAEILEWYVNLVKMMEKEGKSKAGHLQFLLNLIADVNEIHLKLMETQADMNYVKAYQVIAGLITELRQKSNVENNDVQLSLDAIYGYLMLKIQNKEISVETTEAIKRLSSWLGILSQQYKKFEEGELFAE